MKLRQKLAAVMATAMVVTAVPVVTMAASSNTMTRPVQTVVTNGSTTAAALQIKFTGAPAAGHTEVFYLTLENAKWDVEALKNSDKVVFEGARADKPIVEIQDKDDKVLKVTVNNVKNDDILVFPLYAKEINGEAKVKVESKGYTDATISEGEYVFATTAEKELNFVIGSDMPTVYETGKLADIIFSESFAGAFKGKAQIEVELKDADFEFDFGTGYEVKNSAYNNSNEKGKELTKTDYVKLSQGFSEAARDIKVYAKVNEDDKGVCTFTFEVPETVNAKSIGKITLQNLPVRNDARDITTGDLLADITNASGDVLGNSKTNVKVAEITAYSNYVTMKDNKAVDIVAGRIEKIKFEIGEHINDSFGAGREFEITLDNDAHFNYETTNKNLKSEIVKKESTTGLIESVRIDSNDNNKLIVRLSDKLSKDKKDKIEFEVEVCVPVAAKEEEKVTLTASGRALTADVSTTAVNIVNPFDVKMEALQLKVGLQNQVGGKITIEETEKEMFMKGKLELKVVDPATGETVSGIKFYNKNFVDYSTTGDIKKADLDTVNSNGVAAIEIKRQSSSASTLELKDFHVTVDRSVPEGKYDLVLTGTAIDEHNAHLEHKDSCVSNKLETVDVHYTDEDQRDLHKITVKDFLIVGTPNTEDMAVNGLRKGTVEFKVGESKYTVNGKEVAMDAASYIQDPGFTMVPVRYVAESFGISSKDILFSSGGTVTIITGSRTVQLQNNSDIAIVNGAQVKMGTKVVIKDGRTYAPIGEVAQILGVTKGWDNTTKTATFTN